MACILKAKKTLISTNTKDISVAFAEIEALSAGVYA
jgi:hypothetical protein